MYVELFQNPIQTPNECKTMFRNEETGTTQKTPEEQMWEIFPNNSKKLQ